MGNDDTRALFLREIVVRIDPALLILGKERGILHLSDIMIERTGTHEGGLGANLVGYLRSEISYRDGMLERTGATSDSLRSNPLFVSDSSMSVRTDTKPKVFSTTNISG